LLSRRTSIQRRSARSRKICLEKFKRRKKLWFNISRSKTLRSGN
jgi:hypothetical protein